MLIIGIAGGTGSGKSTVVKRIVQEMQSNSVAILPQDSYYRNNAHIPLDKRRMLNFDHPSAIEWELLVEHLKILKAGNPINQPIYSYITCSRQEETITVLPEKVVIVEGILIFSSPELRDLLDIKIYVDADADERILRVIQRDILERDRSLQDVIERYEKTVKPMHNEFIEPTKRFADIIIPQGGQNDVAIDVMKAVIKRHFNKYATNKE